MLPKTYVKTSIEMFETIYGVSLELESQRVMVHGMPDTIKPYISGLKVALKEQGTYNYHATITQLQHDFFYFYNAITTVFPHQDLSQRAIEHYLSFVDLDQDYAKIIYKDSDLGLVDKFRSFKEEEFHQFVRDMGMTSDLDKLKSLAGFLKKHELWIGHSVIMDWMASNEDS